MNLVAADLFCGGGGSSTGLLNAAKRLGYDVQLVAINHWDLAIATHALNHPGVSHINSDLERVDPLEAVPSGHLDLLIASPECTYYSNALGGKPINPQSRATPKWVRKWLARLDVTCFWLENVKEFRTWGPVHRCTCGTKTNIHKKGYNCLRPIESRKGEFFRRFVKSIEALGYHVEWRVLCSADYGTPQKRHRLFMIGRKDGKPITWPEPTHVEPMSMFAARKEIWRTALDVVDLDNKGTLLSEREVPLSPKTMKRLERGIRKFGIRPLVMGNQSGAEARPIDKPLPTITGSGSIKLFAPFIVNAEHGGSIHSMDEPLTTLTSADARAIVQPFILMYYGTGIGSPLEEPLRTVTGSDNHALVQPTLDSGKWDAWYRMFTPEEYAKGQGFPSGYQFAGDRKSVVKQIGNAVPVHLAEALSIELLPTL